MSNEWDKARDALGTISLVISGVEILGKVLDLEGGDVGKVIATVRDIVNKLRDGLANGSSPQAILTELETLHERLAANDDVADAALRDKFRGG